MRPPGAQAGDTFYDLCTKCDECIKDCPEAIIIRDADGLPEVNLNLGECTFCGICASVCEPGAILPADGWNWRAQPNSACLSLQGVTCRTCEDQCEQKAIRFRPQVGGRADITFDSDLCVGCGACAAACPVDAISFFEPKQQSEEQPC